MELAQVSPPPRRVLNQGDRTALRPHRGTLVEAQPQCLRYLVGFGGASMRDSEVWDNTLVFACIWLKGGESFG